MIRNLFIGAALGTVLVAVSTLSAASAADYSRYPRERYAAKKTYRVAKVRRHRARRPLPVYVNRGSVYRRGGYSYSAADTVSTTTPPPPTDARFNGQTPFGPFDSGFFFSTPAAPHGGNSVYMH